MRALGFKPVETGCEPGTRIRLGDPRARVGRGDTRSLRRCFSSPSRSRRRWPPIAPDGVSTPTSIEARIRTLRAQGYTLVIEGAGGVMVPLSWDYTVLDLAERCDLDCVVVARAGLGTLNHVALTVADAAIASACRCAASC